MLTSTRLFCGAHLWYFLFVCFWTRDEETDRRELEVASAEGVSSEFEVQ